MRRAKRILEGIFLSLLLLLSAASSGFLYQSYREICRQVEGKEFLDLASKTVEGAYELLQTQARYGRMLRISLVATGCCVVFILIWLLLIRSQRPRKARPEQPVPETVEPVSEAAAAPELVAEVTAEEPVEALTDKPEPIPEEQAAPLQPPACPVCGRVFTKPVKFCPGCGTRIES